VTKKAIHAVSWSFSMNKKKAFIKTLLAAGIIAATDNYIKGNIERNVTVTEKFELLDHGITIQRHHNKGLPMNLADSHQKEVAALSGAALSAELLLAGNSILKNGNPLTALSHSLIIGGAVSNTYDRIKKGYVVDYVSFKNGKAIYNVSDFCIITGALLAVIDELIR